MCEIVISIEELHYRDIIVRGLGPDNVAKVLKDMLCILILGCLKKGLIMKYR